jgi:mannose-6-phosphate isomerase-like protein (cupin superfamily)
MSDKKTPTDIEKIFRVRESIEKQGERILQIITPEDDLPWGLAFVQLQECPRHYHNETIEVYVVVKGCIKIEIDGKYSKLQPGDHISLKPGQVHKVFDGEPDTQLMVFSFPPFREKDLIEVLS